MLLRSLGTLFCTLLFAAHAGTATCGGDFDTFLAAMAREAAAATSRGPCSTARLPVSCPMAPCLPSMRHVPQEL